MTRRHLAAERSVEWLAENRNGADAITRIMHFAEDTPPQTL